MFSGVLCKFLTFSLNSTQEGMLKAKFFFLSGVKHYLFRLSFYGIVRLCWHFAYPIFSEENGDRLMGSKVTFQSGAIVTVLPMSKCYI